MASLSESEVLDMARELSETIRDRRPEIKTSVDYFKGVEGRMKFASNEFRDYFERRFRGFSDNWCMPVAQAPVERMHYLGMRLPGEFTTDPRPSRWWERSDAERGLSEALQMMTIAKRSFGMVHRIGGRAQITFENPDSAAVLYDPITRERRAGMVLWQDEKHEYGQLLLPDYSIRLCRDKTVLHNGERRVPPGAEGWRFDSSADAETVPNPLGAVPIVEFRNQSLLDDDPISDIAGVEAMQDTINLVWAYLLNILDYASLPGRAILGGEQLMVPVLDDQGQVVGERPLDLDSLIRDRMIHIRRAGGDTQNPTIAEWSAADPGPLSAVIEQALKHVAAQTRTPSHYLLSQGNTPATGYEHAEAGLVSKTLERVGYANAPVREINRLAAMAEGDFNLAGEIVQGRPHWKPVQYRDSAQLMDGLLKMRQAGFPFQFIAEEYGLSPAEVDRVKEMLADEREASADPTLARVARELGA